MNEAVPAQMPAGQSDQRGKKMPTQNDRDFFRERRVTLEEARKDGNAEAYHKIYNAMLSRANQIVADLSWYSWGKEEAYGMLRDVFAIPPYLGHPTHLQVSEDLAVHREIDKNLQEQSAALETAETVCEIVKGVGEVAQLTLQVVGIGSAVLVVEELVTKWGAKKAAQLLAEQIIENEIKGELQDRAIDALGETLGDADTAHQIADLVGFVKELKTATKERRAKEPRGGKQPNFAVAPSRPPVIPRPEPMSAKNVAPTVRSARGTPELNALKSKVAALQEDQKWRQHKARVAPCKSPEQFLKELGIEKWSKGGLERPVKVVAASRGALSQVRGYITQEKYIKGQLLGEIEKRLGLPAGTLSEGAHVMALSRLPQPNEFELRSYTNQPGGRPYVRGGKYPPGAGVPQWELTTDISSKPLKFVPPGQTY